MERSRFVAYTHIHVPIAGLIKGVFQLSRLCLVHMQFVAWQFCRAFSGRDAVAFVDQAAVGIPVYNIHTHAMALPQSAYKDRQFIAVIGDEVTPPSTCTYQSTQLT